MPVYTNISAKYVINKLYRDLALEDPNYELDFLEWMGEALQFIGSGSQMQKVKGLQLQVTDFKTELPYGLATIQQLRYFDEELDKWKVISFNPRNFNPHEEDSENLFVKTEETYSLNPNYIETSFETGIIELSYKRFPVDEDGYPLIPDNQYFKEALFWYCYKQILLGGYRSKVETIDYHFADQKWQFYCSAARNKANFPDLDEYQRFREMWVGLLPHFDVVEKGFDMSATKDIDVDVVNAQNLVTKPITTDPDSEEPVEDTTPPTVSDPSLTITEL